jgi:hypothetical protein
LPKAINGAGHVTGPFQVALAPTGGDVHALSYVGSQLCPLEVLAAPSASAKASILTEFAQRLGFRFDMTFPCRGALAAPIPVHPPTDEFYGRGCF